MKFNRFIERFALGDKVPVIDAKLDTFEMEERKSAEEIAEITAAISKNKKMFYYLNTVVNESNNIMPEDILGIYLYNEENKKVSYLPFRGKIEEFKKFFAPLFEDKKILKCGSNLKRDWCLLKQNGIEANNMMFDIQIAGYLLNSISNQYSIEDLSKEHLNFDITELSSKNEMQQSQMNLFEVQEDKLDEKKCAYTYAIRKLYDKLKKRLKEAELLELFDTIEMPLVEVLADMQYTGMYVNKEELKAYGSQLQKQIEQLTKEIYKLCNEEFNINSPKQLGEILFEKLQLPVQKKNKNGYSTDVEVLEKLKKEHPVVEKILEYRQITKLNSTFVEGLMPYINTQTHRIHSHFHQTVTATGRISSTDPNLQNIPTRMELRKTT